MFAVIIILALALVALVTAAALSVLRGAKNLEAQAAVNREIARQDRIRDTYRTVVAPPLGARR